MAYLTGTIKTVTGGTSQIQATNAFARIATFFDAHPSYQRIASYAGTNGAPAQFPNNTASGRWGVWKQIATGSNNWNIFIAISDDSDANNDISGSYYYRYLDNAPYGYGWYVGCAWHSSSVAWNGTTYNTGTDNFSYSPGGKMWKDDSVILPCDNSEVYGDWVSGTYPNRPAYISQFYPLPNVLMCADDDSFTILSVENNGTTNTLGGCTFERITPITASYNLPYVFRTSYNAEFITSVNQDIKSFGFQQSGMSVTKKDSNIVYDSRLTHLSASYPVAVSVSNQVNQQIVATGWVPMKASGPITSSNVVTAVMYPFLYSTMGPMATYIGYSTWMNAIPGYIAGERVDSNQRIILGTNAGVYVSASMPWSASFGAPSGRTSYVNGVYFRTGSFSGVTPVAFSELYDPIVTIIPPPAKEYRWFILGNYNYGPVPPPGATDIVLIYDPTVSS